MKSTAKHMTHQKRTANLRTVALQGLDHRFSHDTFDRENHLIAILAARNEQRGFNAFTVDMHSWNVETGATRTHADRLLKGRIEDENYDLGLGVEHHTGGDVKQEDAHVLGVAVVERVISQDYVLLHPMTLNPFIRGYSTTLAFADGSLASSVTPTPSSNLFEGQPLTRVLTSTAPFDNRTLQFKESRGVYAVPEDGSHDHFVTTDTAQFHDLLRLITVMTASQGDLHLL